MSSNLGALKCLDVLCLLKLCVSKNVLRGDMYPSAHLDLGCNSSQKPGWRLRYRQKAERPGSGVAVKGRPLARELCFGLVDREYRGVVAIVSVKNLTLATITYCYKELANRFSKISVLQYVNQ